MLGAVASPSERWSTTDGSLKLMLLGGIPTDYELGLRRGGDVIPAFFFSNPPRLAQIFST